MSSRSLQNEKKYFFFFPGEDYTENREKLREDLKRKHQQTN
jgi:hypothetical protein